MFLVSNEANYLLINKEVFTSQKYIFIDLRSEKEFSSGHIPGAFNLPLLNSSQRHDVGCTYKNLGKREAVALGLKYFSLNCKEFLNFFKSNETKLLKNNLFIAKVELHLIQDLGYNLHLLHSEYQYPHQRVH